MSRDIAPFGVRMPPELKARLEQEAAASGRSLNAEVVHRLQGSLNKSKGSDYNLQEIPSEYLLREFVERFGNKIRIEIQNSAAGIRDEDMK